MPLNLGMKPGGSAGLREVGGDDGRLDTLAAQSGCEMFEPIGRAGDEDEVGPACGEAFGEGLADARRGAGDQGRFASVGFH